MSLFDTVKDDDVLEELKNIDATLEILADLKPDYISFLIGVNDVWHEFSRHNGVDADKYEKIYTMLIEEIKEELPEVKIMFLEPFCLRATRTFSPHGSVEN